MSHGSDIWSGSDFPYVCLKDRGRTEELISSLEALVEPGDTVVDVGSGSGILALAAARAGAGKVLAIEIDSLMASSLERTVHANDLSDVIEVVRTDARDLIDAEADVLSSEIIDTGLLDEPFVPVHNSLVDSGVIRPGTRMLFSGYSTTVQLVDVDNDYYGFTILAPKHEWPYYADTSVGSGWWPTTWTPAGPPVTAGSWVFRHEQVEPLVEVELPVPAGTRPNAVLIEGTMLMGDGRTLGGFNSLNGPKVLPLDLGDRADPADLGGAEAVKVTFLMGGGLDSVRFSGTEIIDLTEGATAHRTPGQRPEDRTITNPSEPAR